MDEEATVATCVACAQPTDPNGGFCQNCGAERTRTQIDRPSLTATTVATPSTPVEAPRRSGNRMFLTVAAVCGAGIAVVAVGYWLGIQGDPDVPVAQPSTATQISTPTPQPTVAASTMPSAPSWPEIPPGTLGVAATGTPLEFPSSVPDYRFATEDKATFRVFKGSNTLDDGTLKDFPVTMNGCGLRMSFVRWRVVNSNVLVRSSVVATDGYGAVKAPPATSGYMTMTGCGQPRFQFGSTTNGSSTTLTDILAGYQEWEQKV